MKYYIIAGEASGDLHGSNLMRGLYKEDPQADIRFWGGGLMNQVFKEHQSGEGLVMDYSAGAIVGVVEILLKARSLTRKLRLCKQDIQQWNPDVVILIDYPGFNFKIAQFAHQAGFKVYYYIAPKVWASREGRIRKLKAYVDRLFIVFPFEIPYFESKGVPFTYKGNPLVDAIDQSPALQETREQFLSRTGLPDVPWIALLAGSRTMEIGQMMPTYMQFADAWHAHHPEYHLMLAAAPSRSLEDYSKYLGGRDYVHVVFNQTYGLLRHARCAVVNSGTASLETALIGTPEVIVYRLIPLTYHILKRIVKVSYIGLGNLILNKPSCRELIQTDFNVPTLIEEVTRLTEDIPYREKMQADYSQIRRLLGGGGASEAVAKSMIESLKA